MKQHSALLAVAILLTSSSIVAAQGQAPMSNEKAGPATSGQNRSGSRSDPRGTGMTGAPSSSNPQAGRGAAGYQTPREVPEAGGVASIQNPNPNRR